VSTAVRDARPPRTVVGISNPVLKVLLRTRAGRSLTQLAVIEFPGRRTGRRYAVVVGWHTVEDVGVVFTPAPWRTNFAGGATATVHWGGRSEERTGTLVLDPTAVANALDGVIRAGSSPRTLGLQMPAGHTITAADVIETGRAMITFEPPLADADDQ
jgi:hypothetical protein